MEKIAKVHWPTASKVLRSDQVEHLKELPESQQQEQYIRYWTESEALLKLLGTGFSLNWEQQKEKADAYRMKSIKYQDYIITCVLEREAELEVEELF